MAAPRDPYARAVLLDKPISYWRLGEGGNALVDAMGIHHGSYGGNVTQQRSSLLPNGGDQAFLVGSTNSTQVPNHSDFNPTSPFSVDFWIRTPATVSAGSLVSNDSLVASSGQGFLVYIVSATGFQLLFQFGDGTGGFRQTNSSPFAANSIYHIAVVCTDSSSAQNSSLYVNGVAQSSTSAAGSAVGGATTNVLMIGNAPAPNAATGYTIDEFAFYRYALSTDQIRAHLRAASQTFPTPMGHRFKGRVLRSIVPPAAPLTINAPAALVTFNAGPPQLGIRWRFAPPAATVTFSAPVPSVQRIRIVAPAALVTFNVGTTKIVEKVRVSPAALVTFNIPRPGVFLDGTKLQVTPAALVTFSAPVPTVTLGSALGTLAPVTFTPGTTWALVICDRFGKPISLISRLARDKQIIFNLNRPTEFSFTVPGDDPRVNRIHDGDNLPVLKPGARIIKAYRMEGTQWVIRFAGFLWDRNPVERDASSSVIDIACTAYDPMQRLMARLCRNSTGSFASTVTFTSTSGAQIAKTLVDRTIQYADAFVNDLGIATTGTFGNTTVQTVSYDQAFVAQAIIDLCDTQTMDVIFQPVDRQNGIVAVMGAIAQRGHDRPSVIFGYDAFPHSALGWNQTETMDVFANDITLYSAQTVTGKKELSSHRTDNTSRNSFGVYEDAQVVTESSQVFLDALADAEILLRKRPRNLVAFKPIPEKSPSPFGDWFLGDTVQVQASNNTGAAISGTQRIYGFTLDIDDQGFEIVSELRVSADAE